MPNLTKKTNRSKKSKILRNKKKIGGGLCSSKIDSITERVDRVTNILETQIIPNWSVTDGTPDYKELEKEFAALIEEASNNNAANSVKDFSEFAKASNNATSVKSLTSAERAMYSLNENSNVSSVTSEEEVFYSKQLEELLNELNS
jgi:hypothetical protein